MMAVNVTTPTSFLHHTIRIWFYSSGALYVNQPCNIYFDAAGIPPEDGAPISRVSVYIVPDGIHHSSTCWFEVPVEDYCYLEVYDADTLHTVAFHSGDAPF